jgi:hypothetical protein
VLTAETPPTPNDFIIALISCFNELKSGRISQSCDQQRLITACNSGAQASGGTVGLKSADFTSFMMSENKKD